jgi:hypothetical protein
MADELPNLVLAWMRRLDEKFDRLAADANDLKAGMTGMRQEMAYLLAEIARKSGRHDRQDLRLDRVERRVDLAPATQDD